MAKRVLTAFLALLLLWGAVNLLGGLLLPGHLLKAPVPSRTEDQRARLRADLAGSGDRWTFHAVRGGEGAPLQLNWLHRPAPRGVAIFLHGFGDDAFGTAGYSRSLPEWDAALFTFRGRDRHPEVPSTLGAWERKDVAAVVAFLESAGCPRSRMLLVGASQGAGVALLALADLERAGAPLAGALLESPFRDLRDAARNHVSNQIGALEWFFRGAVALALERAEAMGRFDREEVSPLRASCALRTPVALLAGDADRITPLQGVREIAQYHPDLVVVRGAGHCEAGAKIQDGWSVWAHARLDKWRLLD
jgi:pimeloyl-ACP methyl ester carboxylesterase